jgi:hypothetical protein
VILPKLIDSKQLQLVLDILLLSLLEEATEDMVLINIDGSGKINLELYPIGSGTRYIVTSPLTYNDNQ